MRQPRFSVLAVLLVAAFTLPLAGQQGGGGTQGTSGSSKPSTSAPTRSAPAPRQLPGGRTQQQGIERRAPRTYIISGRIKSQSGDLGEQVRVEFWNHGRVLGSVFSDLRGGFSITFDGVQGAPGTGLMSRAAASDASYSGGQDPFPNIGGNSSDMRFLLRGGEIRIRVSGYHLVSKPLTGPLDRFGFVNVGTITLRRMAKVEGTAVSLTSLQAPKKARKELTKASKLLKKSRVEEAQARLQKAVEIYPQYAVAWNMLGGIYRSQNQPEKARQAFSESIKADPKYIHPYLGQADIQMRNRQFTDLLETTGTLLRLDPTLGTASYYKAVGHYSLGQFAEAEKSAQAAIQSPSGSPPVVHFMLGSLLARKGTYPEAEKELRLFLQIAPGSPAAVEAQKLLTQMESQLSRTQQTETPSQ